MPQPKKLVPHMNKTIRLPVSTVDKVEAFLIDSIEGKVPHGKWQDFFVRLIEEFFNKNKGSYEQYLYNEIADLEVKLNLIREDNYENEDLKNEVLVAANHFKQLLKSYYKDSLNPLLIRSLVQTARFDSSFIFR